MGNDLVLVFLSYGAGWQLVTGGNTRFVTIEIFFMVLLELGLSHGQACDNDRILFEAFLNQSSLRLTFIGRLASVFRRAGFLACVVSGNVAAPLGVGALVKQALGEGGGVCDLHHFEWYFW